MANNGYRDGVQVDNGASRAAGPVRSYGMGKGGHQQAVSQPVPDPYQQQAYAAQQAHQAAAQRQYAAQQAAQQGYPQSYAAYAQQQASPYGQQPGYAPRYGMGHPGMPQPAYVAPATSVPQQMPKKRRGPAFWIGIIIAVLCVIGVCIFAFTMCDGQSKRAGEAGQLEGKTEAEIQAELDRQVEEGMFNISIASTVQFEDGLSEGEFRIENVPNNPYLMQVKISRDDTGEEIYTTDMIEPNHHIQRDTLDVDLDPGTYECTATFYACDKQTEDVIGQAAAKMLVIVKG